MWVGLPTPLPLFSLVLCSAVSPLPPLEGSSSKGETYSFRGLARSLLPSCSAGLSHARSGYLVFLLVKVGRAACGAVARGVCSLLVCSICYHQQKGGTREEAPLKPALLFRPRVSPLHSSKMCSFLNRMAFGYAWLTLGFQAFALPLSELR